MKKLTILSKVSTKVTNLTGRTGLKIAKYSPELLIVGGVIGIVVSTVLACKATLKLEEIVDEAQDTVARIKDEGSQGNEKYTEKDVNKDLFITYVQTGVKMGKLYLPAVTLSVLSIGSILCSYKILKTRNVALMVAYKGVEEAFSKYRARVVEDAGVDKDREYKYGIKKEKISTKVIAEDGTSKNVKTDAEVLVDPGQSQYAVLFDESSKNWMPTHDYNLMFLRSNQQFANDILGSRGHIFLNEVYDMLGVPRTKAGTIVGWVKGENGDNYVDFGVSEILNIDGANGRDKVILLDFNVDGVIFDQI